MFVKGMAHVYIPRQVQMLQKPAVLNHSQDTGSSSDGLHAPGLGSIMFPSVDVDCSWRGVIPAHGGL